jgi:hypothetical protein
MDLHTAYALASFIEWTHAKDRARAARTRGVTASMEYDELAATCLGDLIYIVAKTGKFEVRPMLAGNKS